MASDFLRFQQDPSWGNIFNNIADSITAAPGKALHNTYTVEQILKAREDRARETEKWKAGNAAADAYPAAVPEATVPPSFRDVVVENQGPVNPNDPTTQPGEEFLPPTTAREQFIDPRALAAAQARRNLAIAGGRATIQRDPSQWAPQQAYGEVAANGLPMDPREQARLQFQTTGRVPTAAERTAPTVHNLSVQGLDGLVRVVGTTDNRTELGTGRPLFGPGGVVQPGEQVRGTGPADQTAPNPLKDEASARERLAVLSRSIGANGPTPEQATQIQQLVDVAYKPKRVLEKVGDTYKERYVQENPIPPWVASMMQPPAAAAGAIPAAPAAAPEQPFMITGGPPTAAPAPAQPVPGQTTAPFDPNATREIATHPGSAIELRKEFNALPEVKNYATAATTWNAAVQSAYTGNKANDLAIVYGFIKLLDSITGVRDAEVKMVGQVGSWAEQVNTMLGQANGKGLDPRTRVNIIETMQRHMDEIKNAAEMKQQQYSKTAVESQLAPKAVLGELMPMSVFDRNKALAVRNETTSRTSPTAPPVATTGDPVADQAAKDALRAKLRGGQ